MPDIVDEQHHPPIADSCPEVDGKLNCPPSPDGKMEPLPDDTSKPTSPTVETIPTRNITVTSPKPAANPLQFIKVGPATLYRSAQEQLKKVEEVKKVAPVKDEGADWQNNLDNWKCSRRKRQEHIIERVVEVKKFELEDHDRNRRRSKTFNEMMEERSSRGRKMSLPIYHEDNSDDLSDLGLSTAQKDKDKKEDERSLSPLNESGDSLSNKDMDKKEKAGVEVVDNDYEKAVQNCISYAETIVKSRSSQSSCKTESKPVDQSYQKLSTDFNCVLRGSNPKIEGKLSELRQRRSSSSNDSNVENDEKKTINVPKVDISKRRELFEKISENDATKKPSKVSNGDLSATKSIRERLTSLEKLNDDPKTNSNRTKVESDVSVKERLSAMERISSCNDLSPQKLAPPKPINLVEPSINLGEPSTVEREIYREDKDDDLEEMKQLSILKDKIMECEEEHKKYISSQMSMASNDMYQENLFLSQSELRQSHYRHNSLDSLDVDKFSRLSNEALKRVQSLEDFDYCGKNYPASCVSGDTDKEDSGILTADVSSSVSQADDYNLHLDQDQSINHHHPINHQPINHQPINHQTIDHQPIDHQPINHHHQINHQPINHQPINHQTIDHQPIDHQPINHHHQINHQLINHETIDHQPSDHQPINNHHPIIIEEITKQTSRDISAINQNGVGDSMNFSYPQIPDQNFSPLDGSQSHRSDYCDRSDISEPIINNVSDQMYVTSGSKHTNVLYGLKNDQNSETVNLNQSSSVSVDPSSGPSQFVISASNPDVFTSDLKESFDPVVNMFSDIMPNMVLTFDESRTLEPPKEKPPPPPVETKIEKQVPIKSILRRLDSTKRIKKELHQKRSSFLGIDVDSDDAYLQQEDLIKPPPDMSAFLQEERRLEQKMYQQSLLRESDSSQGESRDSGVELDRIHHDDIGWHQRHDSEENLTDSEFLERECLSQTEKPWTQHRRSLQDVSDISPNCVPSKGSLDNLGQVETETRSLQDVSQDLSPYVENKAENFSRFDYCRSMPNLQEEMISSQRYRTPPVPPAKKQSYPSRENADRSSASQQMTKQTLQALSAAPKPRLISSDTWMQAKRKPKQDSFNYQHWLIQEAEHRRLIDKSMRQAYPPAKGTSNYVNPPTSTATQGNLNDQWIQPHWQDKNANNAQWANNYQQCQQWNNDNSQWAPAPQQQAQYHTDCGPVQNGNHWPGGSSSGFVPFSNQTNSPPQNDWNGYHNNQWTAESKNQNQNQWRTGPPQHYQWKNGKNSTVQEKDKPLPVSIIQTLTQRVQNKMSLSNRISDPNRRSSQLRLEAPAGENRDRVPQSINNDNHQEKILSVSGKKKCSHCGEELGRGAAMVIESLRLFYHIDCFKCCVCQVQLGDGLMGTDVRVRNNKLHCHNCYSSEDGVKFSCV